MRGREDALGGEEDGCGVAVGPSGDVADAVVAGVEAEGSGDDVCHGFGFGLGYAAVCAVAREVVRVAEEDVPGFVDGGLGCLFWAEVAVEGDRATGRVGLAVGSVGEWLVGECPADAGEVVGEGLGNAVVIGAGERCGKCVGGADAVDGVGLADVEDGQDRVAGGG